MSKKKMILTGHVHRLHNGVLESHGPGDVAPDWVTNPDILTDAASDKDEPQSTPAPTAPSTPAEPVSDGDGLDDLKGDELKNIAGDLGIAKSGSKPELIARIRAKREEESEETTDRDALVAKAKELGFDVDDNLSEVELQALIDSKE